MPTPEFPYKFGKTEAVAYRPTTRRFTDFRDARTATNIVVPPVFGHGNSFTDWGMNGNDEWGDCVFAGGAHETELLANLAARAPNNDFVVKINAKESLEDYAAVTGFNYTEETDQGTDVQTALEYRVNTGLLDEKNTRHKIAAFVAIEPGNLEHIRQALWIFECVGLGIEVPAEAQQDFAEGRVWQVPPGKAANEIVGGHYIPLTGVPAVGNFAFVTWGKRTVMTTGFFKKYCDEAYAFITQDELDRKSQTNWGGFNWKDLQEDLKKV